MSSGGIVVPKQPKWHGRLAARAIYVGLNTLARTWRITLGGPSSNLADSLNEPVLFAIWHNRLAVVVPFWARIRRKYPHYKLGALVSASRDGGLLARTLEHCGIQPVRGSSSRRGPQALREAVSLVQAGYSIAITPDGPRGPKYQVQQGIIALAQLTERAIVPAGAHVYRKKCLRSWDAFQVPLPFARCDLVLGQPIVVSREADENERLAKRLELQRAMNEINRD